MASTMTMTMNESTAGAGTSQPPAVFIERRRGPRYPVTATVEAVDLKTRTRIQARTTDLSRGGCYVDTTSPFPPNTTVKMRLRKDNRSFEVEAIVVYSLPGMGMGLAFTGAEPEQVAILKKWIGELSGELPPELSEPEPPKTTGMTNQQSCVVGTLVLELMRQGILSNEKGKAMLEQIL